MGNPTLIFLRAILTVVDTNYLQISMEMLIQTPCPIRTALIKMCKSLLKKKMKKMLSWSSEKIIQWMRILFSISLMK